MRLLIVAVVVALLAIGFVSHEDVRYVRIGRGAFDWEWHTQQPYTEIGHMCWDSTVGWCDVEGDTYRLYSIVDLDTGNVIEVWQAENGIFALTFDETSRDGNAAHPQRAVWVTLPE